MQKEFSVTILRLKQIARSIQQIGWGYLLFILPILALGELVFLEKASQIESPFVLSSLYLLVFGIVHYIRKDFLFLDKLSINQRLLFLLEYNTLAGAISLLLCPAKVFTAILLGHILVSIAALLWPRPSITQHIATKLPHLSWIPISLFEWRAGIRKFTVLLAASWLLSLVLSWHQYAYLLGVFFFSIFIPSIFNHNEGKELKPQNMQQLHQKIGRNSLFLLVVFAPQILTYSISNGLDYMPILAMSIYYILSIQVFCLLYKYANYSQYMPVYNEMPASIFLLLSPVIPISLVWLTIHYIKVKKRITYA